MSFSKFVATKLNSISVRTIEYKAINSFLTSIRGYGEMSVENQLRTWIVFMIDRGFTQSSRKRYIEKLNTIYRGYCNEIGIEDDPFESIMELRSFNPHTNAKQLNSELTKIEKILDILLTDAKTKPELAIFLYLMLNATADIRTAIYLTTENYKQEFPQLSDIIKPDEFHHSRKYIFNLKQSRKRTTQLIKEVFSGIEVYFLMKGINFHDRHITTTTILTLWALKARKIGVKLSDIKQILGILPEQFEYLRFVPSSNLTEEEVLKIKLRVAESFLPSSKRWFAMKVRRGFDFYKFQNYIKNAFGDSYEEGTLFYPQKQIVNRVNKKNVIENVPIITDVVFFHLQLRHVKKMDAIIRSNNIGWIFRNSKRLDGDYSVISTNSMTLFQQMIGQYTPDLKIELTHKVPIDIGRDVIITGGIMAGYQGRIYDIKEDSNLRQFFIRISDTYYLRAEATVNEIFVKPINREKFISDKE